MSSASALAAVPVAVELYSLLRDMDPVRWRDEGQAALQARLEDVDRRLAELRASIESRLAITPPDEQLARLRTRLGEIEDLLRARSVELRERTQRGRDDWMAFRARLVPAYDQLAEALLAEAVHVPRLRLTNYKRNLLHVASGFVAFGLIQMLPSSAWLVGTAMGFFVYAWSMEIGRRASPGFNDRLMRFYGPVAHPHEWHRVNSATWYCTALLLLALTGSSLVCSIAVVVLGVGDPTAALVGRRWGRIRLLYGRSLEGSLTFISTSTLVAGTLLALFCSEVTVAQGFGLAFIGAVAGALAELASRRVDDNLTIPVAAGLAAYAASLLLQFGV